MVSRRMWKRGSMTSDNYKVPYYAEKAKMVPLFCQYVEENYESDYEVKWSEWLATYEENEAAEEK